jgi:hypothetical protein
LEHHQDLHAFGRAFAKLQAAKLVRGYESGQELILAPGLRCRPLPLRHDAGATFGFRFEASSDLFGETFALGYAADLGSWNADLARELTDVDLLALEFNHDIALEYSSGRSPCLIERVLGEEGHLSNVQAGLLLQEVLRRSTPGRLQHVVQLHLSRECNHPGMAVEAARAVLVEPAWPIQLHTAWQDKPSATVVLGATVNGQNGIPQPAGYSTPDPLPSIQLTLPGMGDEDASEN